MPWLLTLWGYRKIIGIGAICLFLYFLGYETRVKLDEAGDAERLKTEAEAQIKTQREADEAAADWERRFAILQTENKKLTGRLRHETSKAIYSNCIVPTDGVQIFNDALSSGHGTGESSGRVP